MRKFLASVGNAKLIGKVGGKYQPIADVRTLTESTLSFANTMEEVRAGQGAQLYGRFAHDSGMTVTLTDAMFDINYIALQVGAALNAPDLEASGLYKETVRSDAQGNIALSKAPTDIGTACGLNKCFVWYREKGCDAKQEWDFLDATKGNKSVSGAPASKDLCVEYFVNQPGNNVLQVSSNFIPAELILIITTKLFAGDASAPETGKPVGEITIKIPRFQLDGTFDLSMAMSAAATMSLQGTALAVDDGTCDGKGVYAEIVEIIDNVNVMTGLMDAIVDPDSVSSNDTPIIYGKYENGAFSQIDKDYFDIYHGTTFASAHSDVITNIAGANVAVIYNADNDNADLALPTSGDIFTSSAEIGFDGKREQLVEATDTTLAYYAIEITKVSG